MFKHILVAADGSETSIKSIKYAVELAKKHESKLTVLTVSIPYSLSSFTVAWQNAPIDSDDYDKTIEEAASRILQEANDIATVSGVVMATRHISEVSAATAIVDTADQLDCDLIIMASHGRRGVVRRLLGSQTNEVLQMSRIPVLVYR
ncbi:universal stress protein [Paenochrobactrum sp. BZR 588]|uniref:universal stress protein n=1 Tax=Paenochrobactrum TaxID=999488 RepID=UPI0035BBECC9